MDLMQREGRYSLPPGASTILGVEFSGHVEQVGEGVSEWVPGDDVFGLTAGVSTPEHPAYMMCQRDAASVSLRPAHIGTNVYTDTASIPLGRICGICCCAARQPDQETRPLVVG